MQAVNKKELGKLIVDVKIDTGWYYLWLHQQKLKGGESLWNSRQMQECDWKKEGKYTTCLIIAKFVFMFW